MSRPGQSYEPLLAAWNAGSIIVDIADRAGIPYDAIDTSLVEGSIDGFSVSNNSDAFAFIEEICEYVMCDPSNFDGVLHFIPRGGNLVFDIKDSDLIDDGKDIESDTRRDAISVPRLLTLEYYDTEGGLTQDKQSSERALDSRANSETKITTSIIMRADDAARSAVVRHKTAVEEARGEITIRLGDNFVHLANGDVGLFRGQRMRVTKVNIDEGEQEVTLIYDRKSANESSISGVPASVPETPPSLIADESRIEVIDALALHTTSAEDQLGYWVAVSSLGTDWNGAVVELSRDGGASWIASDSTRNNSIMGSVVSASMAVKPVWYRDDVSTVRVKLLRPDMDLAPTDMRGMMNRANFAIIGNELINFRDAEQVADDEWELSGFLRGRRGSTISAHSVGERFVMLDEDDVTFIPAELYDQGRSLVFRVTSIDREGPDQVKTITYAGLNQTERQPAYLKARRSGGQIIISWQGVGRIGGGASVGMGAYFTGYRVTVGSTVTDTTARTLTVTDPGGTVTITVRQLNSITGAGPTASITL